MWKFIVDKWEFVSGVGVALLGALGWLWKRILRAKVMRFRQALAYLERLPQVIEEHQAMQQQLNTFAKLPETVATIAAQLLPNGGSSIADGLARMEAALFEIQQVRWAFEDISGNAFFQADADGKLVRVSSGLCDLLGTDAHYLTGNGWVSAIHGDDRVKVFAEWQAAVAQVRRFEESYRIIRKDDGRIVTVSAQAAPLRDSPGRLRGFVGVMNIAPKSTVH